MRHLSYHTSACIQMTRSYKLRVIFLYDASVITRHSVMLIIQSAYGIGKLGF